MVILSLKLGKTLDELYVLPGSQIAIYMAYYELSPFGDDRDDLRSAIVACASANAFGGKAKVKDFIPKFDRDIPKTFQDLKAKGKAIHQRLTGEV